MFSVTFGSLTHHKKNKKAFPSKTKVPLWVLHSWFITILLSFVSCSTISPPKTSQCLFLASPQKRESGLASFHFPAGVYKPDFESETGTYYVAPSKVINESLGLNTPMRGGIYIPHSSNPDQAQAGWVDNQESAGGLVGFAATAPTRLWPFMPPISFQYVREKKETIPEGYSPAQPPETVGPK